MQTLHKVTNFSLNHGFKIRHLFYVIAFRFCRLEAGHFPLTAAIQILIPSPHVPQLEPRKMLITIDKKPPPMSVQHPVDSIGCKDNVLSKGPSTEDSHHQLNHKKILISLANRGCSFYTWCVLLQVFCSLECIPISSNGCEHKANMRGTSSNSLA